MKDYTRSFAKIVPSIRKSTMDIINKHPLMGTLLSVPTRDGYVEVFIHKASTDNKPVLFEFHGGGFALNDARKDDNLRQTIRGNLDINVVGVNYRKAPEHPFPAAINDCYDVIKYFHDNGDKLGVDTDKFAVVGFSAGANLATVTAIQVAQTKEFQIKMQILHYPHLDSVTDPREKKRHPADLPIELMDTFTEMYCGGENLSDYRISPLYATEELLRGTAKAYIFPVEDDALCEEGIAYGEKLKAAGVPTEVKIIKDAYHGYIEDLYNLPCYETLPEDTRALHHEDIANTASQALEQSIVILKDI